MGFFRKLDDGLASAEGWALVFLLAGMTVLSFAQVLLRNLFDYGIVWADVVNRHAVLWVGFVGASLATRMNRHIGIDVLSKLLPKRLVLLQKAILALGGAVVCVFLTRASLIFVGNEKEDGQELFGDIPLWPFETIIPIGFALIGLRYAAQTVAFTMYFVQNDLSKVPKQEGEVDDDLEAHAEGSGEASA